jgi:outer membrane lipoprotein-sorting protein
MLRKFIAIAVFMLLISGTASALELSADFVSSHGEFTTSGKMYITPDKFRMDMSSPQNMSSITRMDKKVVWNVMHDQKSYMELPFVEERKPRVEKEYKGEIERKLVGKETIQGHPTEKYLITYKARGNTDQVYQWWATDINFPIKTEDVNGKWKQEYKNIKMGKQDDSLFEIPEGYNKFDMPGGMMLPGKMKTQ